MTQPNPTFGDMLDPAEVAELIGLDLADLDPAVPPAVVSTGTAFAIVPLSSAASLARLSVRQQQATKWLRGHGARWFYVLGPTGASEPDFRARMQFNGGEDPATGSAAGCAIAWLVQNGAVAPGRRIHLRQGVEIARPSDLYLSADMKLGRVTNVRVAGSTVLVAKGQLFLR
jgi:trans-2,3-dihydro-3-hydroxyanthranilate isomerase